MSQIPTVDAAKAVSHPLRVEILKTLDGKPRSPKSIAAELGQPIGNVSYHVTVLRDLGAVELTGTTPARGAVEHFYRARWRIRLEVETIE